MDPDLHTCMTGCCCCRLYQANPLPAESVVTNYGTPKQLYHSRGYRWHDGEMEVVGPGWGRDAGERSGVLTLKGGKPR